MTKGTRSLGRAAAIVAPVLVAVFAASCGSVTSSGSGTPTGTSTGIGVGGSGGVGSNTGGTPVTSTTGTNGTGGNGGTGGVIDPKCATDADCANDPKGKVCDAAAGTCVECTKASDGCAQGKFCDPATNSCKAGCTDNTDCMSGGSVAVLCDLTTNSCVGCLNDSDCPLGNICASNHVCVEGCSPMQGCDAGKTCCGASCHDLTNMDVNNCGACGNKCPVPAHAFATCADSMCGMGLCDMAYANCDGMSTNGCEQNILQDGACTCVPGTTQACYQGAPGTMGVGPCKGGTQTCNPDGISWSSCGGGQVLPKSEICGNQVDDDCDGVVDNAGDSDGDGWAACSGDCNDSNALVNPGAFEVVGNGVDDDCDPASSDVNPAPTCSTVQKFGVVTASDVAKAMDLCQTTTANPPLLNKKWGLITSSQLLAGGQVPSAADLTSLQNSQTAVLVNYGTGGIVPHKGPTMAGLSSGVMRDAGDAGYAGTATSFASSSTAPASYLAAHGGNLPSSAGCSGNCPAGSGAYDSDNVRLQIRVPTNAKSFSYDFRFFSAEYWSWQCTSYNDFYLAILQTGAPGIPVDKNITFDANNNPVSVNNGFFQVCTQKGCNTCPSGTGELQGTGMEVGNTGGGTTWLTTDAPIVPGETMQIELMVFDVSDHTLDSLVLLDNFRWNLNAAVLGTHM
jgi:hypothetical protein